MIVDVFPDRCIGSGNCARLAPAVFDQDQEEGYVILLVSNPAADEHSSVLEAAAACPAAAIRATE